MLRLNGDRAIHFRSRGVIHPTAVLIVLQLHARRHDQRRNFRLPFRPIVINGRQHLRGNAGALERGYYFGC